MQTFLPYPDFVKTAKCLDYKRLCKQRLEAMQLINTTEAIENGTFTKKGWQNHPARLMWLGSLNALKLYHNVMIQEWVDRGYKNNMKLLEIPAEYAIIYPRWLGDPAFHASHRSNLLRKDATYYSQFNWTEPNDLPYVWPSHHSA